MVIYCTSCWKDNPPGSTDCLRCGARLEADNLTFIAKLIRAVSRPEPLTAQRAAWILGELKAREAVEALIGLVQNSQEMGLPESAVEALGKIGDDRAVEVLAELITSSYLPVRIKAVTALKEIGGHRALTVLKKALNDPSPSVSRSAREAIEALHSAEMGTASRYLATGRGRCVPISIGPWSLPAIFWSEEYQ